MRLAVTAVSNDLSDGNGSRFEGYTEELQRSD